MTKLPGTITDNNIKAFKENGYLVIKQALGADLVAIFENYALMQRFNKHYLEDPENKAIWRYADVFTESLLLHLQPFMERVMACKLYPTNSVLRIYKKGGILKKHIDRATCQYSVTVTMGYDAGEIYPIWVESKGKAIAVALDRGDLLIYKGCEVPHWRETFSGNYWIQVFLHYVDADGPFAQHKYDGRIMIGLNKGAVVVTEQVK